MFCATGGVEKMAGKAAGKPELEAKGEQRQVCRFYSPLE